MSQNKKRNKNKKAIGFLKVLKVMPMKKELRKLNFYTNTEKTWECECCLSIFDDGEGELD